MRMYAYSALFAVGLFGDVAPTGCGCGGRRTQEEVQSQLTEAFRVADENLPKVESGLTQIEAKPSPEALQELRILYAELEKVHKGLAPLAKFKEKPIRPSLTSEQMARLAKEQKRYADLPARFRKVLSSCGLTLLSDEEQRNLDDVLRRADAQLTRLEPSLVSFEKPWSKALRPEFERLCDEHGDTEKLLGKVTGLLKEPASARLSEELYARLLATSTKCSRLRWRLENAPQWQRERLAPKR
jgi:hypothetical protein